MDIQNIMEILYIMEILNVFVGLIGAVFSTILLFTLFPAFFIKYLVNDIDNPSKPYFFTDLKPGRIVCIMRGGNVKNYLMNWNGYDFAGNMNSSLKKSDPLYWDIIEDANGSGTDLGGGFRFWKMWKTFIHKTTGAAFVGLYPWQELHVYKLDLLRKVSKASQIEFIHSEDGNMSDHVRCREFTWYVEVKHADTKEAIPVSVFYSIRARIVNPHKTLWQSDRWDESLNNAIITETTDMVKHKSIHDILTSDNQGSTVGARHAIATRIQKINDELQEKPELGMKEFYGIEITQVQVLDVEPEFSDPEERKLLRAPWAAKQNADAQVIEDTGLGEGKSIYYTKIIDSLKQESELGRIVQQYEAQIATAERSNSAVMFGQGQGSGNSTLDPAIFDELRRLGVTVKDLQEALQQKEK